MNSMFIWYQQGKENLISGTKIYIYMYKLKKIPNIKKPKIISTFKPRPRGNRKN